MESAKKILPYILIAIVFAVGGYFIGKGVMGNQGASLFGTNPTPVSVIGFNYADDGTCWLHFGDGSPDVEGETVTWVGSGGASFKTCNLEMPAHQGGFPLTFRGLRDLGGKITFVQSMNLADTHFIPLQQKIITSTVVKNTRPTNVVNRTAPVNSTNTAGAATEAVMVR